jgi:hypothetical protein
MQHDKTAARSACMCEPCGSIISGLNDTNRTRSAPDKTGGSETHTSRPLLLSASARPPRRPAAVNLLPEFLSKAWS